MIEIETVKEHIKKHLFEMTGVELCDKKITEITEKIVDFIKKDFSKEQFDTDSIMFLITEIFFVNPEQSLFNESREFNSYNRLNIN